MKKEIKEWAISIIIVFGVFALIVAVLMFPKEALGRFGIVVLISFIVSIKQAIFNKT